MSSSLRFKGQQEGCPSVRASMTLDRSKPPRSGHGRPPFWERPSLELPGASPWVR